MLPRSLYELLPFIYLALGAIGSAVFDSELTLIASLLMMLVGFIVLWMRVDYRRSIYDVANEAVYLVERSDDDRREQASSIFPMSDDSGAVVIGNRRLAERRTENA